MKDIISERQFPQKLARDFSRRIDIELPILDKFSWQAYLT
jgi:hypothetical protein